jgi:dynein heavy chain 2
MRLFRDRLVDPEAEGKFDNILGTIMRQSWRGQGDPKDIANDFFTALGQPKNAAAPASEGKEADPASEKMSMLNRVQMDAFKELVEHGLMMYEREEKELNLLLFREVLDNFSKVDRVLSTSGGSLLLVGRAGVGRRTAVTVVAHMHQMRLFSPKMMRGYSVAHFKNDLKEVCQSAGVAGAHTVLYIEDYQITQDAILEVVNSLLSSGEVPGLYTHEELEPLLSPLKELMLQDGARTCRTPYEFFVSRVRDNLHICLGMDPDHPQFLVRCESNPALYMRCGILWLGEWSPSSLAAVPHMLLENAEVLKASDAEQVCNSIVDICRSRRATPRQFVTLLNNWTGLYDDLCGNLNTDLGHLKVGLSKLQEAADTVDHLEKAAKIQQKELAVAQVYNLPNP